MIAESSGSTSDPSWISSNGIFSPVKSPIIHLLTGASIPVALSTSLVSTSEMSLSSGIVICTNAQSSLWIVAIFLIMRSRSSFVVADELLMATE